MKRTLVLALSGAIGGLIWSSLTPRGYTAQATIFFPSIQPAFLRQLTTALQAEPVRPEAEAPLIQSPNTELSALAVIIFQSRAAAEFAINLPSYRPVFGGTDPIASFQQSLRVESPLPGTVRLQTTSFSAQVARNELQRILDFYSDYVEKTPLTRTKMTRQQLDARRSQLLKRLEKLEIELSQSSFPDLRHLGSSARTAPPQSVPTARLKRAESAGKALRLLEKLQQIRTGRSAHLLPEQRWLEDWMQNRQPTTNLFEASRKDLTRQNFLERARLERAYYEALMEYRSLELQLSFLLTWESLESCQFQFIEPVSTEPKPRSIGWKPLIGAIVGLLLAMGLRSTPKP